jgi:hypothetical protein
VPIVIDHFGGATGAGGVKQPGFGALVSLVKSGKAYVKISGAADSVSKLPDLADATPLAQALVAANPQRILWGTNWPHPDSNPVPGRKPNRPRHPRPDRRWQGAQHAAGLCARRSNPAAHPGGKPRTPLRLVTRVRQPFRSP